MIDSDVYKIYYGDQRKNQVLPARLTYHTHFIAREYAFNAYDTRSKIIKIVKYFKNKVRTSYYRVIPGSRGKENYRVLFINCKTYRKVLVGLTILRWWKRVTRRGAS